MLVMRRDLVCICLFSFLLMLRPAVSGAQYPEILWCQDLSAPSFGSSAVGDIDADGKPEIVFGTYFGDEHIYALNAEDGSALWDYDTGGCNDASPAIADVDGDSALEVVIPGSSACKVYCLNGATGDVKWQTPLASSIDSPPAVADVDNDGKPEVILGTFNGYVYCLNGEDGSQCWRINLGTDSFIESDPAILDCDSDGDLDVVVAQWRGDCRVYALDGVDGSTLWYSDLPQDWMYHGGSFADIDEDGKMEIAIGSYDNHLYVLNSEDGSLVWDYPATGYVGAPTSIGDLNNDDHLEIVFAYGNNLGVLSHTGSLLWSYPTGGDIFRGAAIADINGDGIPDVVFGSGDGELRVASGDDGSEIWTYDLSAHYGDYFPIDHAPTVADFNGDGKLDVFVVGGYGTYPPDSNYGRAYALSAGDGNGWGWAMFRHDLCHSAYFETSQVGIDLLAFSAKAKGESAVELVWRVETTGGEQIAGFNLYRRPLTTDVAESAPCFCKANSFQLQKKDAGWTKINSSLIIGQNPYTYIDNIVESGKSYEYKLEAVLANESTEILGTASYTPTPPAFAITKLYPNPASDVLNIILSIPQTGDVELELYDLSGRMVQCQNITANSAGELSIRLEVSELMNGVYTLRVIQDGAKATAMVVLAR